MAMLEIIEQLQKSFNKNCHYFLHFFKELFKKITEKNVTNTLNALSIHVYLYETHDKPQAMHNNNAFQVLHKINIGDMLSEN